MEKTVQVVLSPEAEEVYHFLQHITAFLLFISLFFEKLPKDLKIKSTFNVYGDEYDKKRCEKWIKSWGNGGV